MMSNKSKNQLLQEIKDLIKVNNKNVIEHQKVEKENIKLRKILQLKEEEFKDLKKTTDEVFLDLKQLSESQKQRILVVDEANHSLLDKLDLLELEVETDKKIISKLMDKKEELETLKEDLENKLEIKEMESKEKENERNDKIKVLEMNISGHVATHNDLQDKLELADKNKKERIVLINKMQSLSESNGEKLENLKKSVKNFSKQKTSKCKYGVECSRWFCRYDHRHVFYKDNRRNIGESRYEIKEDFSRTKNKASPMCENICENLNNLRSHTASKHGNNASFSRRGYSRIADVIETREVDGETDEDTSDDHLSSSDLDDSFDEETESGEDDPFSDL